MKMDLFVAEHGRGIILAGLLAVCHGAGVPCRAEDVPYGHADFYPSPNRPIGYRGEGNGWYPGAE